MVKRLVILVLLFVSVLAMPILVKADDVPTMTKEQLRPMLGRADLIIIDVRTKYDWDNSKTMIPGAVREEGMKFGSWMNKYPKDKTIVLYCA